MDIQGAAPESAASTPATGDNPVLPPIRYPLLSMWLRPQGTIRHILSRPPHISVLLLAVAAETAGLITPVAGTPEIAERFHWFALLVLAFAAAPPLGIAALYINAFLVSLSGKLLGGRATQRELRAAFAWAGLPNVVLLVILTAGLLIAGQDFLKWIAPAHSGANGGGGLTLGFLLVLNASIWALVLRIRTIGAVQQFGVWRSIANLVLASLTVLVVAGLALVLLFQPFHIPAASMEPTLLTGDHIFASKTSYGYSRFSFPGDMRLFGGRIGAAKAKRGDIAVFRHPADTRTVYVKRIVGLPGDEIQMKDGVLNINGGAVRMEQTDDFQRLGDDGRPETIKRYRETLPNGVSYFVLDAAAGGAADNTRVYKVPPGHYFMLGDNRDHSMDSRFTEFGFVPAENLVGRAALTYFSAGKVIGNESLSQAFDNLRWKKMFRRPK